MERIGLVGVIGYRFEVLGGVIGFGIGVKEEDEDKIQLLLDSLRGANVGLIESRNYQVPDILTKTDYVIIKELIKKPRMEIMDALLARLHFYVQRESGRVSFSYYGLKREIFHVHPN